MLALTLFLSAQLVGSQTDYTVRSGDSLTSIGARFGVSVRVLAEDNRVDPASYLRIGQPLKIDNRHIVATASAETRIIVNIPQRMLFWKGANGVVQGFPIAAGKRTWKTPIAPFTVLTRETDPTWEVPLSIQEEMRREGKPVLARVPPSPENPLGKYWLGLSIPGVGIHGTNTPASMYSLVTHGCIRLHPEDIERLFSQVELGTSGEIVYEPLLMTRVANFIYLEAHPDFYRKGGDSLVALLRLADSSGYLEMLDLNLVRDVLEKRDGIARDVTRRSPLR